MPHWNLRTPAQVSQPSFADHLFPTQSSTLDTAVRHIGFQHTADTALFQSFLQVNSATTTGSVLQTPGEGLMLGLVALIFVAIVIGGFALWSTIYESKKSLHSKFDEHDIHSHHNIPSHHELDSHSRHNTDHHHFSHHSEETHHKYNKKATGALRLFPNHLVGTHIYIQNVLTTEPEDLIVEILDDQGYMVARALVCESGPDPGILIEDTHGVPLVFIDTNEVVNKTEKCPTLHIQKLGEDEGFFGLIRREDNNGRLVVRNASGRLLMALQGHYHGTCLNAVNHESRLVASIQRTKRTSKVTMLHEADAGVLICGLLGTGKIGKLGDE